MGEIYTCRGQSTTGLPVPHRINLFDGKFDTGWRVISFRVAPADIDFTTARSVACKLGTVDNLNENRWDWSDQREIAWAYTAWDSNAPTAPGIFPSLVDPDQIIVEDLFFYADEGSGGASIDVNYFIELEKVSMAEWRGALSMARDAQSD
jgi:hypothetical protein